LDRLSLKNTVVSPTFVTVQSLWKPHSGNHTPAYFMFWTYYPTPWNVVVCTPFFESKWGQRMARHISKSNRF